MSLKQISESMIGLSLVTSVYVFMCMDLCECLTILQTKIGVGFLFDEIVLE